MDCDMIIDHHCMPPNVLWLESAKGIRNTDSIAAVAADQFNHQRSSAHAFGDSSFHLAWLPHLLTLLLP